jgi:hypothetical protein
MRPLPLGEIIIDYTNWKGERRERRVLPRTLWFGTTEHHPGEPQWFILALDVEKGKTRDFALKDIHSVR